MMKLYSVITLMLMLVVFAACKEARREQAERINGKQATSGKEQAVYHKKEFSHVFSDPTHKDTFRIILTGDSVLTSSALFQIIKYDGSVMFQDTFSADFLIDYGIVENPTKEQMEAYILERVDNFFEEKNFMKPALPADRTFDANYSDKKVWDDIQRDTAAVGFYYKLGKEDGRYLAYSKSQDKVVLYFNCC